MTAEPSLEFNENPQSQSFNPDLLGILDVTNGPIFSLDWSPDSRMLASSVYGQVKIWDGTTHTEITALHERPNFIWGLAWSPNGSRLASASQDGIVRLWNAENWHSSVDLEIGEWAFCVAWSPDGKRLAVGTGAFSDPNKPETVWGKCQLWDIETHQKVRELAVSSFIISTAWSPDGRMIAIGQWDGKITLWDSEGDLPRKSLVATYARSDVNGLAWSPDGRMLASAQQDGKVRIWNPETGEILKILEGQKGWLRGVAWSPDATRLAVTGEDAHVQVWRTKEWQMLANLVPGALPTWSLKWSPNGHWLAAGNGIFGEELHDARLFIYKMP